MTFQPGEIVNITIKGVRVIKQHSDGAALVRCDDGVARTMPPQAAITRADDEQCEAGQDDRFAAVLAYLDRLEAEGGLSPSVAADVRKVAGLPPRHWPPKPGDVWHDGGPFGSPLWFAQRVEERLRSRLVLVPERKTANDHSMTPEEWLDRATTPKLTYRREDDQ